MKTNLGVRSGVQGRLVVELLFSLRLRRFRGQGLPGRRCFLLLLRAAGDDDLFFRAHDTPPMARGGAERCGMRRGLTLIC